MNATTLEDPPGFVVRSEARQAAEYNGYRIGRAALDGWMRYGSTTAPGDVWIAGVSKHGPWLLSIDHVGAAGILRTELGAALAAAAAVQGPGGATFLFATPTALHAAVDRVYKLSVSLPDAPLNQFRARTAALPKSTEAERLAVQRIGQDIFRAALMDYWGGRCPLTGISEPPLLRASHIIPWADCSDELRLDVHNGLLLSALWDAAFDKGLVSFDTAGQPLASPSLGAPARHALGLDAAQPLQGLRVAHKANLAAHRARFGF
jgi:hypothetical protein